MSDAEYTLQEQIEQVKSGFRHLVVLGAGATKASCIDVPEAQGKEMPLMNDLVEIIGLNKYLSKVPSAIKEEGFEAVYSYLYELDSNSKEINEVENKVYDYFDSLKLSDLPTIYDYLILSLRNKDVIATFNWDPFLFQAYARSKKLTRNLPKLAFLHGNVAIGICEESKTYGPKNKRSLESGEIFKPIPILYPVAKKDYNQNDYIRGQWDLLSQALNRPARVSIFGYSAPKTDVEAISIMKEAWGKPEENWLTQFEIIDIKPEEELTKAWDDFIFSHHYEIHDSFFDSSLYKFPRRTGEVFEQTYIEARFYEENKPPRLDKLEDLWGWYSELIKYEN